MTQTSSRLILDNHDANKKAMNEWFNAIIEKSIFDYAGIDDPPIARFLYVTSDRKYLTSEIIGFPTDISGYDLLTKQNYVFGFPILACSVAIAIEQVYIDSKRSDICMFITRETPLECRRQMWIKIQDPTTKKYKYILDSFLSINCVLPPDISKFNRIITPFYIHSS